MHNSNEFQVSIMRKSLRSGVTMSPEICGKSFALQNGSIGLSLLLLLKDKDFFLCLIFSIFLVSDVFLHHDS